MNDSTFLRNLARRGRVVLLADGTAIPAPTSVVDDESMSGSTFYIELISPEGVESGDRRQFEPGTITWRELPIPLMWQWQLQNGHDSAVIVGRIDYIEQTENGLGHARGVFDSGPWGREAERLVRAKMLRGVSGDYSNFTAEITDAADDSSGEIKDNAINVTGSKLVSATLVAKPAFEGCYISIPDGEDEPDETDAPDDSDDYAYDDGVIEANVPITASALIASGMKSMVDRLERLELLEYELEIGKWQLTASAARDRVETHRLQIEAERARARVNAARNMTAAWKPLDKGFLSMKAKLQPRDSHGRWIEMGSSVRWKSHGGRDYHHGTVKSFDSKTGNYTVSEHGGSDVSLKGKDLEVVKATIPNTPEEAAKLSGRDRKKDAFGEKLKVGDRVLGHTDDGDQAGHITSLPDENGMVGFTPQGGSKNSEVKLHPRNAEKMTDQWLQTKKNVAKNDRDEQNAKDLADAENWTIPQLQSELINRSENNLPDPGFQEILDRKKAEAAKPAAPSGESDEFSSALDGLESAMKGAGFDPADTEISDYFDELKNNPETRDANQIGAVEDWVNSHRDEMTDADQAKVDSALDGVKKSLDSSASDLTVPDSWDTPAPPEPSSNADSLDQLAKDFENSPEGQRAKNLHRLEQFIENAESGNDPEPVKPLEITDKDGDLAKTFHGLELDNEDNNIRADEGEFMQSFEQRILSGDKPTAQEWTNMNNDITLYNDELPSHEYDQLKKAWDDLKKKGSAPALPDKPDWLNDSRRLSDGEDGPAEGGAPQ